MIPRPCAALLSAGLVLCVFLPTAPAQTDLKSTRATLRVWIETEKKIAAEASKWAEEKANLDAINAISSDEIERLRETLETSREEISKADAKRQELLVEREALKKASAVIMNTVEDLEGKVHMLYPRFPEPLQTKIDQLYSRMPKPGASGHSLSLSDRMLNVIGILSQVDNFNGSIRLERGMRELEDGRKVEIKTLYLGIAYAFFIDKPGTYAGYGVPSEDGWEWVEDPEMAAVVKKAIGIYEDPQKASYVYLPVTID